MSGFTLRKLKNTEYLKLYRKLVIGERMSQSEKESILTLAILLLNAEHEYVEGFGYRIVVMYCNRFSDYEPLYDIALSKGYIPITKFIEGSSDRASLFSESFMNSLHSSFGEIYRTKNIYLTFEQSDLASYFNEHVNRGVAVVAPTSYGKSELFVDFCNEHKGSTIAIIVPTKALLAQMKKRVLHGKKIGEERRKIISHPEMYSIGDIGFVGILTQERLLRMLRDDPDLKFDYVFIDEAHNLLSGDERNMLLAKVITLLSARSNATAISYLTPFLMDSKNLNTKYSNTVFSEFRVTEHLKTERFHVVDLRENGEGVLKLYDQYADEFLPIHNRPPQDEIDFLKKYSKDKNIVYLNSPPRLEKFALSLAKKLDVLESPELLRACEDISKFLHKDYGLIDCIRKGVIYHHGSVPDVIRLYIENLYTDIPEIRYVVSSSTLLEGVNIPAEALFLLECKKGMGNLSASQFKNLVGRVCRFKELFDPNSGSLSMLEPEIYVVASSYMPPNANIESFIRRSVKIDKKITDKVENVLLEEASITEENRSKMDRAIEILENLEPGITGEESSYAETEFGKLCYANNITEINIIENEIEISNNLVEIGESDEVIAHAETLMELIHLAFIFYIPEDSHRKLQRLSQTSAKKFYMMFIEWRMRNASYSEMIRGFLDYWGRVDDPLVYADKWGNTTREGGHREYWVDVSKLTSKQKVNLAIVRIKEEQDFLDNQVMKFVEVFNDLGVLDENFYLKIKYGTTDIRKITMMKNGVSAGLASLLLEKYLQYLEISVEDNTLFLSESVLAEMIRLNENRVQVFEAGFFVSD